MPETHLKALSVEEDAEYIDDLWFTLHHSEDENRLVLGLRCYVDDSGSDDGSELVVCGGPVMTRIDFKHFSTRWATMFDRNQFVGHRLEQPLHMSDFVGSGKHSTLFPELKRALFRDVSTLINAHKLFSISIGVPQAEFKNELDETIRKTLIGSYGLAFFTAVALNQGISERIQYDGKISYLLDEGFGYAEQLTQAHSVIVNLEKDSDRRRTGALAFDADDCVPMLQAADVIAWAARKRQLLGALPEGFEPLNDVLTEGRRPPHTHVQVPTHGIKMLTDPINNWVSKRGIVPSLADVIRR